MSLKELLKSILSTSSERIKNPFIGAFAVSWLIFNWKPLLILVFADLKLIQRIQLVDSQYSKIGDNLIWPLIVAVSYMVILPYLMFALDSLSKWAIRGRKKDFVKSTVEDLVDRQLIVIEEVRLEKLKSDSKDIEDLNEKVRELKNQNSELKELNDRLVKTTSNLESKLRLMNTEEAQGNEQPLSYSEEYEKFKKLDFFRYFDQLGIAIKKNKVSDLPDLVVEKYYAYDIIEKKNGL